MRTLIRLTIFAAAVTSISLAQSSSDSDERAIRGVIASYMEARNSKDSNAVRRLFTADADQIVSTGEWRRGLDNLVAGMAASSRKETGTSSITVKNVRALDSDIAVVDGRYQTTSLQGATREMWTTIVMKRTAGEWRIAAIRNMLPTSADRKP